VHRRDSLDYRKGVEKEILAAIRDKDLVNQFIEEILALLHDKDGNLRVGAAELLGGITPLSLATRVIGELEAHLNDASVRDYAYGVAQNDEEDVRSVAMCAKSSIDPLRARASRS
jgi:hypothetical protein